MSSNRFNQCIPVLAALVSLSCRATSTTQTTTPSRGTETPLVLHPNAPNARALLWRVERNHRYSYLFGTLHDGVPLNVALGVEGQAAFSRARVVCVELDLSDTSELLASVFRTVIRGQLPANQSLHAMVGDEDWRTFTQLLPGIPAGAIDRFQPWLAAFFAIGVVMDREAPADSPQIDGGTGSTHAQSDASRTDAMDIELARLAHERGLPVLPLETADDQLAVFSQLSHDESMMTIHAVAQAPDEASRIIRSVDVGYLGRNAEQEMEQVVLDMRSEAPAFARLLFDLRNERWMPNLERVMTEGGAFVAVGAGHTVGSKGLVTLLRERGFTVTRVHVGE